MVVLKSNNRWFCVLTGVAVLAIAGCSAKGPEEMGMAFPPPAVSVFTVNPQDLPVSQEYVGQTAGSREVEIRARVSGILERRFYQEGSAIKAGAPLFLIDPKPYASKVVAAEAQLARAQARSDQTRHELERIKSLVESKVASQKEFDDATANVALAQAEIKASQAALTEARLNLGYTRVNTPIEGIVGQAQMVEGALVSANSSLLTTLVQIDPLFVHFSVSENEWLTQKQDLDSGSLRVPADSAMEVRVKLANGQILERVGQINFRDVRIDNKTGTVAMRATLPNADGALKIGQFVNVIVSGAVRPGAITVPQGAVLEGPQGKYVYVIEKDDKGMQIAQSRPVDVGGWTTVGGNHAQQWIIRKGLVAGEQVILDNLIKLRPGAPVQIAAPVADQAKTVAQPNIQ